MTRCTVLVPIEIKSLGSSSVFFGFLNLLDTRSGQEQSKPWGQTGNASFNVAHLKTLASKSLVQPGKQK